MQVNHTFDDIINNLKDFVLCELFLLFVKLIEKTAVLQILRNELVLVSCNANTHVQNDVGMLQTTQNL